MSFIGDKVMLKCQKTAHLYWLTQEKMALSRLTRERSLKAIMGKESPCLKPWGLEKKSEVQGPSDSCVRLQ